jgi:hypothetical protein
LYYINQTNRTTERKVIITMASQENEKFAEVRRGWVCFLCEEWSATCS